ncbi:Uncharacterised protein [uncultured Clostridium sp.]|nr:Uncharacterised protein [uncultured Clostridium sp.]
MAWARSNKSRSRIVQASSIFPSFLRREAVRVRLSIWVSDNWSNRVWARSNSPRLIHLEATV